MKKINSYIIEKLYINKNISVLSHDKVLVLFPGKFKNPFHYVTLDVKTINTIDDDIVTLDDYNGKFKIKKENNIIFATDQGKFDHVDIIKKDIALKILKDGIKNGRTSYFSIDKKGESLKKYLQKYIDLLEN